MREVTPLGESGRGGRGRPLQGAVLVVDDERGMRNFLRRALEKRGAYVEVAASAEEAQLLQPERRFDLLILGLRLPGRSGIEWLAELRARGVSTHAIVMTAYADLDTAVAALRAAAADFILKPFRLEQMLRAAEQCLGEGGSASARRVATLSEPSAHGTQPTRGIVGVSRAIRELLAIVRRVAPTSATVLLEGETGTGKELLARAIHELSGRGGAFVPVNCSSVSPELIESELFGHTRGAFTGAYAAREGLFGCARGGTILLDEVAELAPPMQAKLLRVLEEHRIRPVGADHELAVDARVVAATNTSLDEAVAAGDFRRDLFFRLNVLSLHVPPLRARPEDIPALVEHFNHTLARATGMAPLTYTPEDLARLQRHSWPGNVRELRNVIERALLLGGLPSDSLQLPGQPGGDPGEDARGLRADGPAGAQGADDPWALAEVEKRHMLHVLSRVGGNQSEAARRMGVSRKTLERKLKAWRGNGSPGAST